MQNYRAMKHLLIVMAVFLTTPAQAFEESAESYYARHHQSCQTKARDKWFHVVGALRPTITDECCALSVAAAKKAGGTFVDLDNLARAAGQSTAGDDECPAGQSKNRLECKTSKSWCAERAINPQTR